MRKWIMMMLAALTVSAQAFPTNTTTATFDVEQASSNDFSMFNWKWSGMDEQWISATFDVAIDDGTVAFRLSRQKTGTITTEILGFAITGTNATIGVSHSNIPPAQTYYAEFCLVQTNGSYYRSLAKGRVTTMTTLWDGTNSASYTNNLVAPLYPNNYILTTDSVYLNAGTNWVGGTNINVVRSGRIYTINSDTNPIVGSATNAADTMAIAKYAPQSQTNAIRIGATGEAYTASVTLDTDATNATRVMADAKYLGILRAQMTDNTVSSDYAMAIGSGAYANGSGAVALGLTTWAVGAGAFAHGNASRAQAADAEVGGNNAYADHSNSYVWADSVETHSSTSQEYTVYASKGVRLNPTVTVNGTNVMPTLFAKADGNHTHTVFTNDLTMSGSVVSNATFIMTNNTAQSDLIYGGSNAVQWIRGTNTYILLLGLP